MARAALTALNAAAGSWDVNAPHDLRAQDSERFLRVASACAQVAIADRLTALTEAIQARPAAAGALGTDARTAVAAEPGHAAKRLAAGKASRLAGEAGLWRLQQPLGTPPPPPSVSCLHTVAKETQDRQCPECGGQLFDIVPRSVNPLYLRCCQCGTEITIPVQSNPRMMSQVQMDGMYAVLSEADAARDAEALAGAAWRLYAEAVAARTEAAHAQATLAQLTGVTRATVDREAGGGPS